MTSSLDMFNNKSNGNLRASPPEPPDKKSLLLFVSDSCFGMSLPSVLAHSNLAFGGPLFFVLGLISGEGFTLTAISVGAFLGFLLALLLLLVTAIVVALLEAGVLLFFALGMVSSKGFTLSATSLGVFLRFLLDTLFLLVSAIVAVFLGAFFRF